MLVAHVLDHIVIEHLRTQLIGYRRPDPGQDRRPGGLHVLR
jgi:hypothetical protein